MRVLIATVTAGAGHLQAAAALEEAWRAFRPADTVERADVLSYTSKLYRKAYAEGYIKLVERAPELYGLVFRASDNPAFLRKMTRLRRTLAVLPTSKFVKYAQKFSPDVVVCTHFLPPEILGNIRAKHDRAVPTIISVVTDFEAHALWVEPSVDFYFVAAEETKSRMIARGVPDKSIFVTGIPVSARFNTPIDAAAMRKRMGLNDESPVVLVLSGGFGMGPVEAIMGELNKLSKPVQVVVVCGRNEALRETLAKMSHRHPTQVLGFVSNMQDLMTVAELIISKPGGLTTSEALALGRPLLILNPIPGQEAANSDFLLEHGAAAKINRVEDLPSKLDRLLGSEKLAAMASVARSLGRPGAALNICQEVVQLLESEKKEKTSLAAMPGLTPASLKKSSISDGHSVLLYDSLGSQSEDGASWHIDVHGRVFSRKPHPSLERLLARALRLNLEKMKEDERRIFAERAGFFLEDSGKLKPVHVSLGSSDSFSLRSGQNGHFRAQFPIHHKLLPQIGAEGGILEFQASANPSGEHTFAGSVHLLPPTGLSIISDLDDTIKATDVHDRRAMISNTFCSEFRPVPGMADVYQAWAREAGASFHYVSASPWQLYMALRDFTKSAGFPAGTFHLRRVRLKDLSVLTLFASPALHKRAIIAPMLLRYPQRRFILVGDTCGGDPEIYGQLARRFPDQVSRIYVHQTSERLAKQGRLAKAFRNIPTTKWQLFRDPSELPRIP